MEEEEEDEEEKKKKKKSHATPLPLTLPYTLRQPEFLWRKTIYALR